MKRLPVVTGLILVTLMFVPAEASAQSGAHCTSGGSQSSFRMMQRNQMEALPQSPASTSGQAINWLAMFEEKPKRRYLVVPNQEEAGWTIGKAIEELVQLNQRHKFSYSRDELVKMLDEALAANP